MCALEKKLNLSSRFSKLNRKQRLDFLAQLGILDFANLRELTTGKGLSIETAEQLIENVIGTFNLPLGIAMNFIIDNQPYVIPMAVEETSIIAAASKTAKWISKSGYIVTETLGHCAIGQMQVAKLKNFDKFNAKILVNKSKLIAKLNQTITKTMLERGGGVEDIIIRKLPRGDGGDMAILHVLINTCDAMGANIINQVCEYLREPIQQLTQEVVTMCILSNLTDTKLTRAKVVIQNVEPSVGEAIAEASLFANCDPYRAATHNKGVMNGIDPVVIATGNDWRAVEAGIHAYAARTGHYQAITKWNYFAGDLIGIIEAPINVGIVGGITQVHPTAKLSLKILAAQNAAHLARIIAAVGLVQNLGALRALTTEGITRGHLRLHLTNLLLAVGAKHNELRQLSERLQAKFAIGHKVSQSDALQVLQEFRNTVE